MKAHELILVFYQRLPTYRPQMRTGFRPYRWRQSSGSANYHNVGRDIVTTNQDGTRYPVDVVKFASPPRRPGMHPTEKPVDLLRYLIRTYTDEGEVVLDNCMGCGSTGVAAVLEGRKFIGIELDERYFAAARERVEAAQNEKNKNDASRAAGAQCGIHCAAPAAGTENPRPEEADLYGSAGQI